MAITKKNVMFFAGFISAITLFMYPIYFYPKNHCNEFSMYEFKQIKCN